MGYGAGKVTGSYGYYFGRWGWRCIDKDLPDTQERVGRWSAPPCNGLLLSVDDEKMAELPLGLDSIMAIAARATFKSPVRNRCQITLPPGVRQTVRRNGRSVGGIGRPA